MSFNYTPQEHERVWKLWKAIIIGVAASTICWVLLGLATIALMDANCK